VSFSNLHPSEPTTVAGFAFAVPYVGGAATMEIRHHDVPLATQNLTGTLLRDAIASLRGDAFVRPQLRGALLAKATSFEKQIAVGAVFGAKEALTHDIRPAVMNWLKQDVVAGPLEYGKTELLQLIDRLLETLPD
jgi:hypothetical protein